MRLTAGGNSRRLVNAAGLILITLFVLSYFDLSLVLLDTTITGGDTPSQYGLAVYSRDALFSRFQFSGWDFGNLAGYPPLHYYFPLPFIVSAALSLVMPLTIAFKIVTVLCAILLPACVFYLLREMRFAFPTPLLGAALTLPFLFVESQSIWGGNIASMLSGEFSYALGLQLSMIYFASYWRGSLKGTRVFLNACLLAAIALSHGCALLVAGFFPLFHVFTGNRFRSDAAYYFKVSFGAFCLVSPWLLSWLAYNKYTTVMNFQWVFNSLAELFPLILAPTYVLGGVALILTVLAVIFRARVDRRLLYPWFGVLTSVVLFRVAYPLNVPDIRFIPFVQLFLGLAAAMLLGWLTRWFSGRRIELAACLVIVCMVWTGSQTNLAHLWARWNYEGFERKAPWPVLRDLSEHLKGGFQSPRVVYENSPSYDSFGSMRVFEMLPYFSGRATLEGAHLQGSINSPYIFYLQSEVSEIDSCPLPDYRCSSVNLRAALPRLDLFNVDSLLIRSDKVKAEARATPGLVFDKSFPPLDIYKISKTDAGYVRPLTCAPVLYTGREWKQRAYEWFVKYQPDSRFVAIGNSEAEDAALFSGTVDDFPESATCLPPPQPATCTATSTLEENSIQIHTDCIGRPLLVKTSYHPRWKVRGARRIYLVTPGFMLIFPDQENVELTYRWGAANYAGTGLAIAFMLSFFVPLSLQKRLHWVSHSPVVGGGTRPRTKLLVLIVLVATVILGSVVTGRRTANVLFNKGLSAFQVDDFARAKSLFEEARAENPGSVPGVQSLLYLGLSHYKTEKWSEAAEIFRKFSEQYPENRAAPEALYHVGMSFQRLQKPGYEEYFLDTIRRYPQSAWAGHALDRLTEAGKADLAKGLR